MRSCPCSAASPTLLCLSEDLLLKVLDCIHDGSDRKSWRLVCTLFLRLESGHRKSLRVLRGDSLLPLLRLRYPSLRHLDLSICSGADDSSLVLAFAFSPSSSWTHYFRSLVLSRASAVGFNGLEAAVRACPFLEEIDVSYCCRMGDREAVAISAAANLKDLQMVRCSGVTDVGLAKIAVGCPRLDRLNLKWCLQISDLGIDLLTKKCGDLKFLDVSYLMITNDSLRSVSTLPKLETLCMIGCPLIDDRGLEFYRTGHSSLLLLQIIVRDS